MQRQNLDPPGLFDSRQYGFSQGVLVEGGHRLHLSGQVATDAQERTRERGLAGQLEVALDNIELLLREAGTDLRAVTMLRIYLLDEVRDELGAVGSALKRRFPVDPPASSWLIVSGLARDEWLVEIEAEAAL